MLTTSVDITSLNFAVLVDISTPNPTVKFTNLSTGPNLAGCKWLFSVLTPNNIPVHTSSFASPDVTGAWTDFTLPENLPQVGNNIIWSGPDYKFKVEVMDSADKKFELTKAKEICRPNGNVNGSNFGLAVIDVQARCNEAKLYVENKTNYSYKNNIRPSLNIQNKLTLIYPPLEDGTFPTPFVITDFTNGLIPISVSGDGYQALVESIVQYDLEDDVTLQVKYKVKECFPIQCNVDLCPLMCEYGDMIKAVDNDGCDKEMSEKLLLINAKINQALIGKMQPLCKIDVAKLVDEIKELGGFKCDCNCGNGIVALINTPGSSIDCNGVIACVNAAYNTLNPPSCLGTTNEQWALLDLLGKLQLIFNNFCVTANELNAVLSIVGAGCIDVSAPAIVDGKLVFTVSLKNECTVLGAENGLNINNTTHKVRLGGDLIVETTINLKDKNLFLAKYDVNGSDILQYHLTGTQGGTLVEYAGIRNSMDPSAILTTWKHFAEFFTMISSTNADQSRDFPTFATGYLARAFTRMTGKAGSEEYTIGVYVPTADAAGQTYPAADNDKTAYIQFMTGLAKIFAKLILHYGEQETSEVVRTWFKNNVGIGAINAYLGPNGVSNNNSRLVVHKLGQFTNSPIEVTIEGIMDMPTPGNDLLTGIYAGIFADMVLSFTDDQVLRPGTAVTGGMSYLQFVTNKHVSGGNVSAHAAQGYFDGSGRLNRIIAYRAMGPVEYAGGGFSGTIDEAVGMQVEDQNNPLTIGGGTITKTYGVKQLGPSDENLFNGPITFAKVLANGSLADDAAAAVAGVPVGGLYHTAGVIKIRLV